MSRQTDTILEGMRESPEAGTVRVWGPGERSARARLAALAARDEMPGHRRLRAALACLDQLDEDLRFVARGEAGIVPN